jgi:hypothetical protein
MIRAEISKHFDELQTLVNKYEICRVVDKFEREFDFEVWKQDHSDLESIRKMLDDLNKWDGFINRSIKPQESRGLVIVQGRKLSTRLSQKVKEEQGHMRGYLMDLALELAKNIEQGLSKIRTTVSKPPSNLQSYVDYVSKLDQCKEQKDQLAEQKKKLEEMKAVLSRNKGKDEGYQMPHTSLQNKIENLGQEIGEIDQLLAKSHETAQGGREDSVAELDKKIEDEQQ